MLEWQLHKQSLNAKRNMSTTTTPLSDGWLDRRTVLVATQDSAEGFHYAATAVVQYLHGTAYLMRN